MFSSAAVMSIFAVMYLFQFAAIFIFAVMDLSLFAVMDFSSCRGLHLRDVSSYRDLYLSHVSTDIPQCTYVFN